MSSVVVQAPITETPETLGYFRSYWERHAYLRYFDMEYRLMRYMIDKHYQNACSGSLFNTFIKIQDLKEQTDAIFKPFKRLTPHIFLRIVERLKSKKDLIKIYSHGDINKDPHIYEVSDIEFEIVSEELFEKEIKNNTSYRTKMSKWKVKGWTA